MNSADEILRQILPDLSARAAGSVSGRVAIAWPALVGTALAGLTAPGSFDAPTGLIEVQVEAPWRDALFRTRRLLVERLRNLDPAIRGVRLVTVPSGRLRPPASPHRSPPPTERPMPPDPRSAGVADAALRAALDGLCRAWDTSRGPT